jgi:superfamily II DNA or RNA helicase
LRQLTDSRPFQLPAADVLASRRQCAALLRPGMGKTMVAQTALTKLGAFPALVAAPSQVVSTRVWSQEAAEWEHLSHLRIAELDGSPDERELDLMIGADITVVSYELLWWLTERVTHKKLVRNNRYVSVVWDELHKLKHPGTRRFMRLRHWAKDIEVRFGLTGSPMGNHWLDLWGEMFMVAGKKPLGPTLEQYQDTYFRPIIRPGMKYPAWELRTDGSADEIRQRVKPYAFSVPKSLAAKELPQVLAKEVKVEVPRSCRAMEEKLRRELEVELASGKTLYALNGSKLQSMIRQFASGALYTNEERTAWEVVHEAKLDALRATVEELQGEPVLVFTWHRHAAERIARAFPGFEMLDGTMAQVARWNRGEIEGAIGNPQGSGMGLNLQKACSTLFWFDLPWAWWQYDQGCGRVARLGQPDPYVTSVVPLAGALDRRIWSGLGQKRDDEESVVEAVAMNFS